MEEPSSVAANRRLLVNAQKQGLLPTLAAFTRLSGPGWLQSAITLGGGSLSGALFLGVLSGMRLIWLQLIAIVMGVVMLSAISYVTLSTGQRPFRNIRLHVNPVLAWGWLIATMLANLIWCMPQFSLCYAALSENLIGPSIGQGRTSQFIVSALLLATGLYVVHLSRHPGLGLKVFDGLLKALVGMIVVCFFGVVAMLVSKGTIQWSDIASGLIPDLSPLSRPTGVLAELVGKLDSSIGQYWSSLIVKEQRAVMIGAAATAVGINMTFLLPYSMLSRGWDKPFRGLAKFDLATGMAIPYVIVTSCVVIASAAAFHGEKIDDALASQDAAVMQTSPMFSKVQESLTSRLAHEHGSDEVNSWSDQQRLKAMAKLDVADKQIALSLVPRDAFQLSRSLEPLLGQQMANLIFGLGAFGMGYSTIIILMLINSYALCEALNVPQNSQPTFTIGCLMAGVAGAAWPVFWTGESKLWLAILASSFGMMLLPIAYVTFMMMMNSRSLLKEDKPTGLSLWLWNLLMGLSVLGAIAAAATAIMDKSSDPTAGKVVLAVAAGYIVAVIVGFLLRKPHAAANHAKSS